MRFSYLAAGLAAASICTGSAQASAVLYSSLASFQAATSITNIATFEGLAPGATGSPLTDGGIKFSILPGEAASPNLSIAAAGGLNNTVQLASQSLTASGDEVFRIELADGATFNAIGFDLAANRFHGNYVNLYDVGGNFLGGRNIAVPDNTVGFFGLTSTEALSYVEFHDKGGYIQDDGIDNVRIASLGGGSGSGSGSGSTGAGGVPEPATWALMLAGFGLAGTALRRPRPAVA